MYKMIWRIMKERFLLFEYSVIQIEYLSVPYFVLNYFIYMLQLI